MHRLVPLLLLFVASLCLLLELLLLPFLHVE
jgi:hypothetical protein